MNEEMKINFQTLVEITDPDTKEIILRTHNAIHPENMSQAIAGSLAQELVLGVPTSFFNTMAFGNGASTVSGSSGTITYLPAVITGSTATLYAETYEKIINQNNLANPDPVNNKTEAFHISGNLFTDIQVSCLLDFSEPAGQDLIDNSQSSESAYVFDELGILDYSGKLLTHLVFSPIQKSLNRRLQVIYTLRVSIA